MVTITPLYNSVGSTQQEYNLSQEVLIPIINSSSEFNPVTDQVIFSVEDPNNNLLYTNQIFKFSVRDYENTTDENSISSVVVFPDKDILEAGYDIGEFNVYYNFYRPALNSNVYNYFIQNISANRTEIKLSINNVSNAEIEALVQSFSSSLDEGGYFKDFYIDVNGAYYIANNVLLDTTTDQYGILIKLYQALPSSIQNNTQLEVVYEVAETTGFNLVFPPTPIDIVENLEYIKGPNFSYQFSDQTNNSTIESDFSSLLDITQLTSSYNELQNILDQKGIIVNIDYTNFDNFIQFSSAEQRLLNFYYKVGRIESFNNSITSLNTITGATLNSLQVSSSKASFENQITSFIKNFDGYENYLYYSSGSTSYPKSNSTQPYNLQSTGSAEVLTWIGSVNEASPYYGGMLLSASLYDNENQDSLYNTVPTYLSEDPANAGYELFLNMIGQHFDILYSYINTITDRFNTDNRLDYGISRDLVADALRGAGIKLYQNNFSSDDLYSALLGINASGSLLPPTGSEVITNYITASNDAYPLENVNKSTYKRLYHNLPYLLNKKGTVEGLRALINCFGIPDTILRISEFGGKDKDNTNDWDYFQNEFNYSIFNSGSSTTSRIEIDWEVNGDWLSKDDVPESLLFQFKPFNILPKEDDYSTIFYKDGQEIFLTLSYTGSSYTSGSYSGSIPSASNDYATLTLWDNGTDVAHVNAPFYDGNWWGVQVNREGVTSNAEVTLRTANSIYNGNDGFKIGYTTSSIVTNTLSSWRSTIGNKNAFFPYSLNSGKTLGGNTYYGLTGSFQEIRFYNVTQSENVFHDYVMNPHSIEGINPTSSADNLIFRAPLGSELNTNTGTLTSIHPKVTGSYITNSFSSDSDYTIGSDMTYVPQTEYYYYDQPAVGIKNRVSEKIRVAEEVLPTGDTLSAYRSIQQIYPQSESYTRDVNYVEVAFSPQNEINDDINSSMGYFNIGEYIGDPGQFAQSGSSYLPLDKLRDTYFEKYYKNYNWTDYIRLIRYFDNSLFKMIKDFIPARTSLASGVVIKQHLLERNKVTPPQVETSQHVYSGSIESGFIDGGDGGSFSSINRNFANATTLTMRGASSRVISRNGLSGTIINGFGATFGSYGVTGSDSGIEVQEVNQVSFPFTNTSAVPIYFNLNLQGEVSDNALNNGEIEIFSNIRFTTGSNKYVDKRAAGSIYSSSLGNVSVGDSISVNAPNLIIYPNESLTIAISDDDSAAENIVSCDVTFSSVSIINNLTLNSQIWESSVDTPVGPQIIINSSQAEFYNGEFSGSEVLVTNGDLNSTRVIETADLNSGFIAPYNTVFQGTIPAFSNGIAGYELNTVNGLISVTKITLDGKDANGVSRFNYLTTYPNTTYKAGDTLYIKTSGDGNVYPFHVESVFQGPSVPGNGSTTITITPWNVSNYSNEWYPGDGVGVQSMNFEIINDPSITNLQASLEGDFPLLNNVPNNRLSDIYQDVDYADGSTIPVNFDLILNGQAVKFPIPDSNYSQKSWSNGRYNGSKVSSRKFNE